MIKKAVIPAAGFGTRLLPVTKVQPKEMIPIVDTPTIQMVVEEAAESGIEDILIISGRGKMAIEDHFDRSLELEHELAKKGNEELLKEIQDISNLANIHFIRQTELKGLGDAISYARLHIGSDPFVVLLPDVLIDAPTPCTRQLIDVHHRFGKSVVGVEEVEREEISRYGIIDGKEIEESLFTIKSLIEKPEPDEAPSNLAVVGRYLLTPDIFDCIAKTPPGKGGEVQLTDAINMLCQQDDGYAYKFEGKRYDTGNRLEYLKTIVDFALKREDIGKEFKEYIKSKAAE